MSTKSHRAMVVTSWHQGTAREARGLAVSLLGDKLVSEIVESDVNGYSSFFIGPSGSGLGWERAEDHNRLLRELAQRLPANTDWAIVQYGDERGENKLMGD